MLLLAIRQHLVRLRLSSGHTSSGVSFDAFLVGEALFLETGPSSFALRFKLGLGVVFASVVFGDIGVTALISTESVMVERSRVGGGAEGE